MINYKASRQDACDWTFTWSHDNYVTNRRAENQSKSKILLRIWLYSLALIPLHADGSQRLRNPNPSTIIPKNTLNRTRPCKEECGEWALATNNLKLVGGAIVLTRVKKSVNKRTAGIISSVGREPSKENSWVRCEVRPVESCAITNFAKINYFLH